MDSRLRKGLFLVTLAGAISIPTGGLSVQAAGKDRLPTVGIGSVLNECDASEKSIKVGEYLVPALKGEYSDMAFANVKSFLYIRSEPTTESEWVGKLYPENAAKITGPVGEWTPVESGDVKGYVKTEYIYIGKKAQQQAEKLIQEAAGAQPESSVQEQAEEVSPAPESSDQDEVQETEPEVLPEEAAEDPAEEAAQDPTEETAQEPTEQQPEEQDTNQAEVKPVEKSEPSAAEAAIEETVFQYAQARDAEEEAAAAKVETGQSVVDYASQFIGNPYVWGGTSLTAGADCSGFVQAIYQHFGVDLPRTSSQQRSAGTEVNYEDAIAGDLVCYEGHIGIYMGDGKIVNARNPRKGIGITPATYKSILTVRRVL